MNLAQLFQLLQMAGPAVGALTKGIGNLNAGQQAMQIADPQYTPISATEAVQSNINDLLSEAAAEEYGNVDDQFNRSSFRDLAEELMPYTGSERSARSVLMDDSLGLSIPDGRYFDFGNGVEDPMEGFMPMDPKTGMYLSYEAPDTPPNDNVAILRGMRADIDDLQASYHDMFDRAHEALVKELDDGQARFRAWGDEFIANERKRNTAETFDRLATAAGGIPGGDSLLMQQYNRLKRGYKPDPELFVGDDYLDNPFKY